MGGEKQGGEHPVGLGCRDDGIVVGFPALLRAFPEPANQLRHALGGALRRLVADNSAVYVWRGGERPPMFGRRRRGG